MCGNASLCCSFVLSTFKLNLSLIFPNRDRCHYFLESVVITPMYPKNMLSFHSSKCEEDCYNSQEDCADEAKQAAGGKKPNYRKCVHAFDMCAEECPKETKQYAHILHLFELIFLIRAL